MMTTIKLTEAMIEAARDALDGQISDNISDGDGILYVPPGAVEDALVAALKTGGFDVETPERVSRVGFITELYALGVYIY